uniref:NADPH--hemoprotein reductase n=1 Tax=Alexandrium monilatum TaxID=311494 RepID=A0A7S4QGU7_9DINO
MVPTFPLPGMPVPVLGTRYHLLGAEEIPFYNVAASVFPCDRPYPYGATVRCYLGGARSRVEDYPEGTVIHGDAETYLTWTADPCVVEELLSRAAEFPKLWNRPQQKAISDFTGNGLFTSNETSEDWQSGHSVLPRGFNQIKVKSFAPQILDKTRAFVREWSKFSAGHRIEGVSDWLTSMTADAVVACSMGLDMQNVERMGAGKPPHPFIDNFRFGLGFVTGTINAKTEFGAKRFVPGFGAQAQLRKKYEQCKKTMEKLVDELVESTRAGELGDRHSIIRSMLEDRAASGKHVRYGALYGHVINLMIAGHETTAATLGFTMQLLAENPECEARAVEEVRNVLQGRTEPDADDVPKLQYVEQCFREALRLYSPVTGINRDAAHDTLLQGRRVYQGERVLVLTRALHTNPEHWGGEFGNPLSFNPDRFAPDAVRRRHPNAYHPWGFGPRACIGSQFALFEAKTFLASVLLHFKLQRVPGYTLKASLHAGGAAPTPKDLALIVYPRPGGPLCGPGGIMQPLAPAAPARISVSDAHLGSAQEAGATACIKRDDEPPVDSDAPVLRALYGSNSGSSQEFAAQVAAAARRAGLNSDTASLNAAVKEGSLVTDGRLVVVVTSTYNGSPPDNAAAFKAWLMDQNDGSLKGLRFAVFGVGNSQWHTYQQFPREVDAALERCGAERVHPLGACDVDGPSFDSDFDDWLTSLLRTVGGAPPEQHTDEDAAEVEALREFTLDEASGGSNPVYMDIASTMEALRKAKAEAIKSLGGSGRGMNRTRGLEVASASRELCKKADGGRSVRHVTLRLPEDLCDYRAGDHLQVMAPNDPALVAMALEAIGVSPDAPVCWDPKVVRRQYRAADPGVDEELRSAMPCIRFTATMVATWIPDLTAVPSRKVVSRLAHRVRSEEVRDELRALVGDAKLFKDSVDAAGVSLAELLQRFGGRLGITIGELCAVAKPLSWRFYSISSSPAGAADPRLVTLSVGQVNYTTGTGRVHRGLASSYLGDLEVGGMVPGFVRKLAGDFHMPDDPAAPVIMVGPGTGVAPMMGFLQEREHLLRSGQALGPAMLFFGCRRRDEDYLYEEELDQALKSGALSDLHVACSREGPQKVYVQDLIWEHRAAVWKLLQQPSARVYVCGDARAMAPDVRKAFQRVAENCGGRSGSRASNMVAAMIESGRYLEDVWAA